MTSIIAIIYQIIVFGLIILFVVSFFLFIRRILINATLRIKKLNEIGEKLDKIIEHNEQIITLLEKKD
ncbi:DUF4083 domain-containing protein [Caldibacillus thermolactis]|jgi:hypothetical protein|uniref:DUF4083 domain-containing protein n=1 Tax=Pallidibacillus thermolactis TaxID=251051 RepID=A0ABT2WJ13_9BACI|nr:DUF4083 family protein [Pallidibacillus thermolactis]MCU9595686.1 DUF4083 domain-containing protein [Pallidibacillus thermolactis]MCU9602587.1 DUF4083 domain-containing protein [Pallidibacillus thermolactis subsp. kokeshiiformis]